MIKILILNLKDFKACINIMQAYPSPITGLLVYFESVSQCSFQISKIILEDALGIQEKTCHSTSEMALVKASQSDNIL